MEGKHVTRIESRLDDVVVQGVVAILAAGEIPGPVRTPQGQGDGSETAREEVERLRGKLKRLAALWADDVLGDDEYDAARVRLVERLEAAEKVAAPSGGRVVPGPAAEFMRERATATPEEIRAGWDALDLAGRRALVRDVCRVVVSPLERRYGPRGAPAEEGVELVRPDGNGVR